MNLLPTFPPFQLPLYRLADEIGTLFSILKNGIDALKRSLRESGWHLLVVDLLPTHAARIDDITNCYKPYFSRYHLLPPLGKEISSIPSTREMVMATTQAIRAVRGATGEARYFETLAEAKRFCRERGDQNQLWRVE